ncbi:MAG TPA: galactokinase [Opitutaceae bacterium]|nr:galactokinase [Opitutaceae bacterium]
MIITRSPLRVSLGGGGTDLPSYYRAYGGFLVAAAVDKYVYITQHRTFQEEIIVKYSKLERVPTVDQIEHPIVREALKLVGITDPHLELTSMADIPGGTGLGSSGSFTTALLKALHAYKKNLLSPAELAEQACDIEINRLGEPIGKQDQYIAAIGGITAFTFHRDDRVEYRPVRLSEESLFNLEDNLLLFFTGYSRSASAILKDQNDRSKQSDQAMLDNLHFTKELGYQSLAALEAGNLEEFARLMDVHWQRKKARSSGMSNAHINEWYDAAMASGALGGKLIGAGGGGFLMFYAADKTRLRHAMRQKGLQEVRFRFDFEGTKVVAQN